MSSKGTEFDQRMMEALNTIETSINERLEQMRLSMNTLESIESQYTQTRLQGLNVVNAELVKLTGRIDQLEDRIQRRNRYDMSNE
jgi:deoxyadenosine/deoxycytidine kinase